MNAHVTGANGYTGSQLQKHAIDCVRTGYRPMLDIRNIESTRRWFEEHPRGYAS